MSTLPRLFLTSMSGPGNVENMVEMIEPILSHLDGIIWVLNDCPPDDPGARYLETVKGAGKVIHRSFGDGRHHVGMSETLYTGLIDEGSLVIWTDCLERPMLPFVARIKTEIAPMMKEADVGCLFYFGKAFLFPYSETLEYRNTPHWTLTGWSGRGLDWAQMEPNERLVRFNVRPEKRKDPLHWVLHYARYLIQQPAGSNTCALGIEQYSLSNDPKVQQEAFVKRETQRLAFRRLLKARGVPLTLEGLKTLFASPLDDEVKGYVRAEKVLSDAWVYWNGDRALLKDTHYLSDAVQIA